PKPPQGGAPITYSSISTRISDAMDNANLPVVSLGNSSFTCPNTTSGSLFPWFVHFDPFNCYNGTDITAPAAGWWIVTATTNWSWWSDGFSHHMLCLNGFGNILHEEFLDWEFSGNQVPVNPAYEVFNGKLLRYLREHHSHSFSLDGGYSAKDPEELLLHGKVFLIKETGFQC